MQLSVPEGLSGSKEQIHAFFTLSLLKINKGYIGCTTQAILEMCVCHSESKDDRMSDASSQDERIPHSVWLALLVALVSKVRFELFTEGN